METVVEVEVNAESKPEVSKTSSAEKSLKLIADPVVYQLVRVEGDGRLVPATDEEVFEVEDLLDDGKCTRILADTGRDVECILNKKISSGILQSENLEACSDKSGEVLDLETNSMKSNTQIQERVPSLVPSTTDSHLSGSGECSNSQVGATGSESLKSSACNISKPDFSKLKGEICLNNLSVRELHEIFRALFGRVTTNKDKQWLKRRISMGLTNSCDVSTTTFVIEDHKVVKKGKEENSRIAEVKHSKNPFKGAMDKICKGSSSVAKKEVENQLNCSGKRTRNANVVYDHDRKDVLTESRADKRVRKPTKRYIEEVSVEESRETSGKVTSKVTESGHCQSSPQPSVQPIQNIRSDGRPFVMRQDSLGGSGIQIPYVSRVRRGRPRENYMTFMKLQPSEVGTPSRVVKKAFEMCDSRPDSEEGNNIVKAGSSPEWVQQPLISKSEKAEENSERFTEFAKDDLQLQHTDPSSYCSDDGIATVPTATGGMRRKHHRIWTLNEVVKLVEGVARYGVGRWSEIKRVFFASHSHRTSVDLKDKWRNLLRASFAQLPADKGVDNSRKNASVPIPAPILARVRELAEVEGQFPPNISGVKFAGHSVRDVHERRSGYL
ncbi:Telomere repeat-binding protein 6 [Heracleum sosnowskyi]|uniref:Telomere repeat-binding protein 6 n=1 Tax=Heracleum sosnowskyi TaxID=360622 RepID=A0AAD8HYM1_9APIA|nr:Telomere repeat-binding protein 6 [Heracleum sosnowskyi]